MHARTEGKWLQHVFGWLLAGWLAQRITQVLFFFLGLTALERTHLMHARSTTEKAARRGQTLNHARAPTTRLLGLGRGAALERAHLPDRFVEDLLEALLRQGGALEALVRPELRRLGLRLRVLDWRLALLAELLYCAGVLSQVHLRADEDKGRLRRVGLDFRVPFHLHVVEGRRANDAVCWASAASVVLVWVNFKGWI